MKPLAPNTLLQNRYLVVQMIGKGGMGEVYLAVDQRLGSAIAIKRTTISADDAAHLAAFESEAKTLARLRHPALTKVSDHFTENGTQFLVMEHISGDDLYKRLELNKKPFPLDWVLYWGSQLLDALTYLHSQEPPIIHRDIKPQNLKLTDENNIILLDFGLAQSQFESGKSTTGGSTGYTPHYASLEQIRGTGCTARSDIYSFSATIYQLLTNIVPPDALKRADQILNHLPDPLQPVNEINPEISSLISDVVLRGMNLAAEQRYQTAAELQQALKAAYDEMQKIMSAQTMAFSYTPPNAAEAQAASIDNPAPVPAAEGFNRHQPSENPNPSASADLADDQTARLGDLPSPVSGSMEAAGGQQIPNTELLSSNQSPLSEPAGFAPPPYPADAASYAEVPSEIPLQETMVSHPVVEENAQFSKSETAPKASEPTLPPAPVVAKKSGSSYGLIGAILAVGILILAAGAVGFYFYSQPGTATTAPTPAPTIEATVTPTPVPTVEPTVEQVGITDSSNSSGNTDSNSNTNVAADNSTVENSAANTGETETSTRPRPVEGRSDTPARPAPTARTAVPGSTPKPVVVKTPAPPKKTTEKPKLGSKDLLPY